MTQVPGGHGSSPQPKDPIVLFPLFSKDVVAKISERPVWRALSSWLD